MQSSPTYNFIFFKACQNSCRNSVEFSRIRSFHVKSFPTLVYSHTHTHTHIYIYIYIYMPKFPIAYVWHSLCRHSFCQAVADSCLQA